MKGCPKCNQDYYNVMLLRAHLVSYYFFLVIISSKNPFRILDLLLISFIVAIIPVPTTTSPVTIEKGLPNEFLTSS